MLFVLSLIPGTIFVVVGYFVLFASTWAQGAVQRFGQYLAIWIFFLAAVLVLGALLASILGIQDPISTMQERMEQHMQRMEQLDQRQRREP